MIIDATDLILGRMAAKAAKAAISGENVVIVNCDKAVVVGKKSEIIARYKRVSDMGVPKKGPFLLRGADRIVRRTIRGMLPYKKEHGKEAYRRVMCYIGVPEDVKDAKTIEGINVHDTDNVRFITIKQISETLGFKYNG